MSTVTTTNTSRAMTLAQRRRAVLDQGGFLASRRITQKPANKTFYVIFLLF